MVMHYYENVSRHTGSIFSMKSLEQQRFIYSKTNSKNKDIYKIVTKHEDTKPANYSEEENSCGMR